MQPKSLCTHAHGKRIQISSATHFATGRARELGNSAKEMDWILMSLEWQHHDRLSASDLTTSFGWLEVGNALRATQRAEGLVTQL